MLKKSSYSLVSLLICTTTRAEIFEDKISQNKIDISISGLNSVQMDKKTILQFPYKLDECLSNNANFTSKPIAVNNGYFTSVLIEHEKKIKETNPDLNEDTAILTCRNEKGVWKIISLLKSKRFRCNSLNIYYITDQESSLTQNKIVSKTISYHYLPDEEDMKKFGMKQVSFEKISK